MKLKFAAFVVPALILSACGHAAIEKSIDQKLTQESDVKTIADLNSEENSFVAGAKNITPEQKTQLLALRALTRQKLNTNNQESNKMKSVLIQDLVAAQYKENEVELIKSKLKNLQSKRLTIMFQAVEEANSIMGREARMNDEVMRDFVRIEHD